MFFPQERARKAFLSQQPFASSVATKVRGGSPHGFSQLRFPSTSQSPKKIHPGHLVPSEGRAKTQRLGSERNKSLSPNPPMCLETYWGDAEVWFSRITGDARGSGCAAPRSCRSGVSNVRSCCGGREWSCSLFRDVPRCIIMHRESGGYEWFSTGIQNAF